MFLLRYVPDNSQGLLGISPNRYLLVRTFAPAAAVAVVFLLVFGLVGGWILAGRMLAPLTRITDAARMAGNGSLSHRIRMTGRQDEFRELSDTVTVRTEAHGGTSVLRVENTGRRLPPELVPTLTEPFRRGTERVRTDQHAGVGLGLAIVHSIVRAHDGALDVVPRPVGGLLVTVRLPGTP
ncbi:sensor histidine kinase [Streptomyces sp. NBC_00481]|uniref:sensor histidine kinase n=1 Tax=Streptomyces sp. NBC_00481 TaxID=2975755 RepID=UPI002DD7A826|nr:ATP-binding protein [Streptomyces sp. NBC_00481]